MVERKTSSTPKHTKTDEKIDYKGRKAVVYQGPRGGKYVKSGGEFVSVKSIVQTGGLFKLTAVQIMKILNEAYDYTGGEGIWYQQFKIGVLKTQMISINHVNDLEKYQVACLVFKTNSSHIVLKSGAPHLLYDVKGNYITISGKIIKLKDINLYISQSDIEFTQIDVFAKDTPVAKPSKPSNPDNSIRQKYYYDIDPLNLERDKLFMAIYENKEAGLIERGELLLFCIHRLIESGINSIKIYDDELAGKYNKKEKITSYEYGTFQQPIGESTRLVTVASDKKQAIDSIISSYKYDIIEIPKYANEMNSEKFKTINDDGYSRLDYDKIKKYYAEELRVAFEFYINLKLEKKQYSQPSTYDQEYRGRYTQPEEQQGLFNDVPDKKKLVIATGRNPFNVPYNSFNHPTAAALRNPAPRRYSKQQESEQEEYGLNEEGFGGKKKAVPRKKK